MPNTALARDTGVIDLWLSGAFGLGSTKVRKKQSGPRNFTIFIALKILRTKFPSFNSFVIK